MAAIQVLTAANGNTAAPANGTAPQNNAATGYRLKKHAATEQGFRDRDDELTFAISANRTGGTVLAAQFRVWLYSIISGMWYPPGVGGDTTKGFLNGGAAVSEYATNLVAHWERVAGFKEADGVYLQILNQAGVPDGAGINGWLLGRG
jgi:hypothetical protein